MKSSLGFTLEKLTFDKLLDQEVAVLVSTSCAVNTPKAVLDSVAPTTPIVMSPDGPPFLHYVGKKSPVVKPLKKEDSQA
jgi:hypothetical protein